MTHTDKAREELNEFLHLIFNRCWWLFDTAAPMNNRVGAQAVVAELGKKIETVLAYQQSTIESQKREIEKLTKELKYYHGVSGNCD